MNKRQQFQRNDLVIHTFPVDRWDANSEKQTELAIILHSDRDDAGSGRYSNQHGRPTYAVFREKHGFLAWITEDDLQYVSHDRGEMLELFEDEYRELVEQRRQERIRLNLEFGRLGVAVLREDK